MAINRQDKIELPVLHSLLVAAGETRPIGARRQVRILQYKSPASSAASLSWPLPTNSSKSPGRLLYVRSPPIPAVCADADGPTRLF